MRCEYALRRLMLHQGTSREPYGDGCIGPISVGASTAVIVELVRAQEEFEIEGEDDGLMRMRSTMSEKSVRR